MGKIRPLAVFVSLVLGLLGSPGVAQAPAGLQFGDPVPPGAVAVVDGIPIPEATFEEEMVARYLRPGADGQRILSAVEDEMLINAAASAKGLSVTEADLDRKCQELDTQLKASQGKSLADTLAENQIPYAVFRSKTRGVTLLERLCRAELALPPDAPVENLHQRAWLKQARDTAKIDRERASLPAGTVAMVNGQPISSKTFVEQLVIVLDDKEIRKLLDTLVQEVICQRLMQEQKLELTPRDLEAEFELQRATFRAEGQEIPFEDLIRQQTGLGKEAFIATRGFRVKASLARLAQAWFTAADLEQAYPTKANHFGPKITLRHILFGASEKPDPRGKLPSFEAAMTRVSLAQSDAGQGMAFADLVVKYSDDTATKFSGGLLRPFAPGRSNLDQAIVEAGSRLEVGQISAPVRSAFGWHLLQCERRDPLPPLAEVEGDLRRLLAAERFKAAYEAAKLGVRITRSTGS